VEQVAPPPARVQNYDHQNYSGPPQNYGQNPTYNGTNNNNNLQNNQPGVFQNNNQHNYNQDFQNFSQNGFHNGFPKPENYHPQNQFVGGPFPPTQPALPTAAHHNGQIQNQNHQHSLIQTIGYPMDIQVVF
jgi:hypothetical protein